MLHLISPRLQFRKMILGIGCDSIEIERIRSAIQRHGHAFVLRLFSKQEIEYCQRYQDPVPSIAGRFAAKEALVKALGCGFGSQISWHNIEILNNSEGKPYVIWHNNIENRFAIQKTHLSISHSKTIAIAYALIEERRSHNERGISRESEICCE